MVVGDTKFWIQLWCSYAASIVNSILTLLLLFATINYNSEFLRRDSAKKKEMQLMEFMQDIIKYDINKTINSLHAELNTYTTNRNNDELRDYNKKLGNFEYDCNFFKFRLECILDKADHPLLVSYNELLQKIDEISGMLREENANDQVPGLRWPDCIKEPIKDINNLQTTFYNKGKETIKQFI